jgi:hypothetical protein
MKALVIWWHNRISVYADGRAVSALSPTNDAAAQTIVDILRTDFPNVVSLRLLYLPADLRMEPAECPQGNRKSIQRALQHDYPVLENNVAAWAAQPPIATEKAAVTFLSIERVARLHRLVTDLEPLGVIIEAAFPLLSWLERLPSFASRGHSLAILHADDLALIYARDDQGGRHVYQFDELVPERTREIVGSQISQAATSPSISVVSFSAVPLEIFADPTPTAISANDFIAEAWNIPPRDPSNFFPPQSRFNPSITATVAGAVLALSALIFVTWHEVDIRRTFKEQQRKTEQLISLEAELTKRTAYNKVITEADLLAADVGTTPSGLPSLLQFLEQSLPREIDVTAIKVKGDTFTVEGLAHAGTGLNQVGPYFQLYDALAESSRPWKLVTQRPTISNGPTWEISGIFSNLPASTK